MENLRASSFNSNWPSSNRKALLTRANHIKTKCINYNGRLAPISSTRFFYNRCCPRCQNKKNLHSGEIIEDRHICVVCRNETVTIKAIKFGMLITTKGVALTDGSHGEQIKVKNIKSNRIISGQVTGISEVTVIF